MTFNENKINLQRVVTIKFQDKMKVRHFMKREPLLITPNAEARNYMVYFGHRHMQETVWIDTTKYKHYKNSKNF